MEIARLLKPNRSWLRQSIISKRRLSFRTRLTWPVTWIAGVRRWKLAAKMKRRKVEKGSSWRIRDRGESKFDGEVVMPSRWIQIVRLIGMENPRLLSSKLWWMKKKKKRKRKKEKFCVSEVVNSQRPSLFQNLWTSISVCFFDNYPMIQWRITDTR